MSDAQPTNSYGQPIGPDLDGWTSPAAPTPLSLTGRYVTIKPLSLDSHVGPLFAAFEPAPVSLWTYLPWGPFRDTQELEAMLRALNERPDWQVHALLVDAVPVGFFCYLRINPAAGSIEVGGVVFSPALQRTRASTEAQHLLMKHAFDIGYRRYEWKCDALNAPSRVAAERLGFSYEGVFKKASHYKGRSRDTAWFAITDDEWPTINAEFERWLDPANFDARGMQLSPLLTPTMEERPTTAR